MNKKYLLVEHLSAINTIIKRPLQQTHRIKFTSFDVSLNYIVFGATSGGVYIFTRYPCKFIKLLPSKEGSITQIVISPDDKTVALSTARGLVIVIENCFCDTNINYQIYTEHEGNTVTAMKWYNNDLYCGDHTGQISMICLTHLLSKAIFQTPSATLMNLDSAIVQFDVCSKFLLISTKTRTYLCDTELEQYRQIGKKLREGPYGACFFNTGNVNYNELGVVRENGKSIFKILKDDELFTTQTVDDVKIYCARPGCRLWEVNFESSVLCTHQFRHSLHNRPTDLIHLSENDGFLNISQFSEVAHVNFNFEKLFVLNKFILTFKEDGIYIFDVNMASLMFWSNYFTDIKDLKIIKNCIYIWLGNCKIKCLAIIELEYLILKMLSQQRYSVCAELCLHYKDDVLDLIEDDKLELLSLLKNKLEVNDYLYQKILPMLEKIKEHKQFAEKLNSGIFLIDNCHSRENGTSLNLQAAFDDQKQTLQGLKDKFTLGTRNLKQQLHIMEDKTKQITNNDLDFKISDVQEQLNDNVLHKISSQENEISFKELVDDSDVFADDNYNINIIYRQYQANKINKDLEVPTLLELLNSKLIDDIPDLFNKFVKYITDKNIEEENKVKSWCYFQFLRYIAKKEIQNIKNYDSNSRCFTYLYHSFVDLNRTDDTCACSFPLPTAKTKRIQFYDVGCEIVKKMFTNNDFSICKSIPAMYKFIISTLRKDESLNSLLPVLTQFSDLTLLSEFSCKFTYDLWDEAIKLLVKLKNKVCLNCEKIINFDKAFTIHWNSFGKIMVKSIGGSSTLKLFTRYSDFIPPDELDREFYQICIFTNSIENLQHGIRDKAVDFLQEIQRNEQTKAEFDILLSKYLTKKYVSKPTITEQITCQPHFVCSSCDIFLQSPILEPSVKLSCGHFCHKICFGKKIPCKTCNVKL